MLSAYSVVPDLLITVSANYSPNFFEENPVKVGCTACFTVVKITLPHFFEKIRIRLTFYNNLRKLIIDA